MKIKTILAMIIILLAGGGLFIWLGLFNIAATEKHWPLTTKLLEVVRERSIHVRSETIKVPELKNPEMIARGANNYAAMCAQCHLAPGMAPTELNQGLYPNPPAFSQSAHAPHDPAAMFWTIKNGLKLTGMPAWGSFHTDQQIWELVAFVSRLKDMSKTEYTTLTGKGERSHGQEKHTTEESSQHMH
ncbi:c-type cytochrome [Thiolapillus brandeum]|uniref:Cytochrome c family protein n=1 Tax=Thiolapillus brandeum TaxID=1076588 RepID=A0A7U6JIM6_9GAMM|nr:cytochrome c [Thiolapillus brandeum]BAO44380.1 cytochrome c family protein [Thiolapillus brandeum]